MRATRPAIRRLLLLAAIAGSVVILPRAAGAQSVSFRASGHVAVSGGVRIHPGRWRARWRRPVPYRAPWAYRVWVAPPPVVVAPAVCTCDACYPPAPPPAYDPAEAAPAAVVAAPAPARRARKLGVGLRASGTSLDDRTWTGQGMGALVRFRGERAELELELAQDVYGELERIDTRVGGTVYLNLGRHPVWYPYLLAGLGVNVAERRGVWIQKGSPCVGDCSRAGQVYLEGGGGLGWRLTDRLTLSGDVRWSSRRRAGDDGSFPNAAALVPERERGLEGRLSGIVYF